MRWPLWTLQEKELLRQLYPSAPITELESTLNRTAKQIRNVASLMGIKRIRAAGWVPRNIRPVGSERMDKYEGMMIRKIASTGQPKKDWKRVDVIEWEALHGPIPPGLTLTIKNTTHPRTMDNLELLTKSQHFARISVNSYPPELARLHQLRGQITQAINRRTKAQAP